MIRALYRTLCANRLAIGCGVAVLFGTSSFATAYPLDGDESTGIVRLRGYRELQTALLARGTLHPGSLLGTDDLQLRLVDQPDFTLPERADESLSRRLSALLGDQRENYAVAVLDLSDPEAPRYLAHQPNRAQNPGSIGKLVVGLAWFQALADLHPDDTAARARLLRETEVVADRFVRIDTHEVPFWKPGDERIVKRPLREGDRGNLYTYLDWMFSSSSNAAASMSMQQLVLLRHFGSLYPTDDASAQDYLSQTPRSELGALLKDSLTSPLERNGLDPRFLRQGGMFTREGKNRMPGGDSNSTARELLRYLMKMEQGLLVDPWSSLELKRLMYLTDRRIRYASHPALSRAAVYFKSGSLYQCQPEEGFVCGKYMGNVRNFMNSVAIIESKEPGRELHYLVAVLSNVLRENSAVAHQTLALRIHRLIESLHPIVPPALPAEPATLTTPTTPATSTTPTMPATPTTPTPSATPTAPQSPTTKVSPGVRDVEAIRGPSIANPDRALPHD